MDQAVNEICFAGPALPGENIVGQRLNNIAPFYNWQSGDALLIFQNNLFNRAFFHYSALFIEQK
jgi:hypothetical protein